MRREVVEHYHVARPDRRAQDLLDVCVEGVGIDRPFNRHRRLGTLQREGADDRSLWPVVARHTFRRSLAARGTPIQAGQRGVNARLVNKAQASVVYLMDAPPEPCPLVVVALCGGEALFLCGRSRRASARQMVET